MNLYLAIIFFNFLKERKKFNGKFLTDAQSNWLKLLDSIIHTDFNFDNEESEPSRAIKFLERVTKNIYFILFIYFTIGLNLLLTTIENQLPRSLSCFRDYVYFICLFSGLVEQTIKFITLKFRKFFRDKWNFFDLVIVFITSFEMIKLFYVIDSTSENLFKITSTMRVFRFLRVLSKQEGVRKLLKTIVYSLPSLLSIFLLLFIILFLYANAGNQVFANLPKDEGFTEFANFDSFFSSFFVLLKIATADDWVKIMLDVRDHHG
jgi:hypothetical protein